MDGKSMPLLKAKLHKMCSKKLAFTSWERDLIVALVQERPIIEDKRIHAQNIELKRKAWNELTTEFNSHSHVTPRNHIQLKRCWENIKTQRKKVSQESMGLTDSSETEPKIKRSSINMQESELDSELLALKIKRENILIKREESLIEYEKQIHDLQTKKLNLEIEILNKSLEDYIY
ncbi:unnamed protein product [Chrysodeixis includens]|uniref:Regulatory protein zeste n=1 Tax=Chrysodeixis includens TaxID=689277 RepID=A0A9P0BTM3_CHRIL|nr:unnamed protein product [Chrysodeixis includens]